MTTKVVPDDAVLGKIAKRQHELFRRVKEGSLDPSQVLSSLQAIVENQVECLDIEKVEWEVSSKVHEITVREGRDFVSEVKALGFLWDYGHHIKVENLPVYKGSGKKRRKKARFRLAKPSAHREMPVCVIKAYAEMSGYELADPWELLSFVQQSAATRIMKPNTRIIALGNTCKIRWSDTGKESISYIRVGDYMEGRNWNFQHDFHANTIEELDERVTVRSSGYVLLRERD